MTDVPFLRLEYVIISTMSKENQLKARKILLLLLFVFLIGTSFIPLYVADIKPEYTVMSRFIYGESVSPECPSVMTFWDPIAKKGAAYSCACVCFGLLILALLFVFLTIFIKTMVGDLLAVSFSAAFSVMVLVTSFVGSATFFNLRDESASAIYTSPVPLGWIVFLVISLLVAPLATLIYSIYKKGNAFDFS